jgi:gamma-tubulin complex component 3
MGDERLERVDGTLTKLFEGLIPPPQADEDPESADERIDGAIEYAKRIVAGQSGDVFSLPDDVNQAQDLIKRKLLRENASPEKAARFSNLYSRLLAIPVLNQKWSILYLLYKLSESSESPQYPRSPLQESQHFENLPPREQPPKTREARHSQQRNSYDVGNHAREAEKIPNRQADRVAQSLQGSRQGAVHGATHDPEPIQERPVTREKNIATESELLRDLPFNLQGLSSKYFTFTGAESVRLPTNIPVPIVSLLHTLAEPCLLYKKLADFTQSNDGGLVSQSLRAAINTELRSYLSLVATLEGEIRRAMTAVETDQDKQGVRQAGVTLKRCVIWTRDATMGLRLMSLIVEESKQKRGGQLISLIHGFSSSHGDPFVSTFASRLLTHVTRPFYDMLRRWIYDGELVDPFHEFFVTEPDPNARPDVDPRRVATSVWEDKYKIDKIMVPTIISDELARKIFLIGKSLNFIRHNCGDSDWVIDYSKTNSKSLDYANTATLSSSIDTAYATTMSRLTMLMSTKFHLFTHLTAIKKYILLSQGDFIDLLMESLAPNLDRPANSQYRHNLTSQLEHAIRHSNAQYDDADVLRRLDARMLELSSGEIGWDCFTLEYKISAPCDVVITQWASTQYLKVFNLLWRIKRVEFSLNASYRRCMTGARGVLRSVDERLGNDWKRARCVVAEMVHFVNQLQYYILFEVIEASWEQLETAMQKPDSTLDDLIEAHTKYINSITHKGLLGQQKHATTGHREDSFLAQLHYILKCMLGYRDVIDGLYSFSVAEFTRKQQFEARVEQRTAAGKWGITERDLDSSRASTPMAGVGRGSHEDEIQSPVLLPATAGDDKTVLTSLRGRLLNLSAEFRSRVNVLLYDLAHQPDVDMRFLGVVMNFNEVYKPVNRRRLRRQEMDRQDRSSGANGQTQALDGNGNAQPDVVNAR